MHDVEHLILGGGCSGLSLATRLAARPTRERGRVLVIESRARASDKTWCSWSFDHPFRECVSHRWSHVAVRPSEDESIHRSVRSRPYEQILATDFEAACEHLIARADAVELRRGVEVRSLREAPDVVTAETNAGTIKARLVWDARGGAPHHAHSPDDVQWIQHFVGWVVRTESPIFDTSTATLMDFRANQRLGPHFIYVLPYSRTEALVEDTYFGPTPFDAEAEYENTLRGWLERHRSGHYEIVRSERGHIPMNTAALETSRGNRVIPIGLRSGAAKPSTGYAFAFIQRQVEALARTAGKGESVPRSGRLRTRTDHFFDRVFLSYLQRNHQQTPAVFGALFKRAPIDSLIRFLAEEASPLDYLAVMNSVPRRGVAAEIARSRRIWMGR